MQTIDLDWIELLEIELFDQLTVQNRIKIELFELNRNKWNNLIVFKKLALVPLKMLPTKYV